MNVLILFGASSTLGQAIIELNKTYNEVLLFDRKDRFRDASPYNRILLGDFKSLVEIKTDHNYKIVYLAGKKFSLNDLDADLTINIKIPLQIFAEIEECANVEFCYIGSQGDIHASPEGFLYNSSKRYVGQYLEGKIFDPSTKCIISIYKPWIFQSKMYMSNAYLKIKPEVLAKSILTKKYKSKIYLVPRFTYFFVTLLYTCTPRLFFYNLVRLLKK